MSDSPGKFDLKNPGLAALLAWLVPGLGHIYQGRTLKGVLFAITILGLFFFGSWLGSWRVVYLRWDNEEWRFSYLAQVGAGLVAFPAALDALDARPAFARIAPPLADYQSKPLSLQELQNLCERMQMPRGGSAYEMQELLHVHGAKWVVTLEEVDDLHRKY